MNTEVKKETIAPGETIKSVLIAPFGNWPNGDVTQICDDTAFGEILENWETASRPEILCDFEHKSETDRLDSDTEAAAWISNLRLGDNGLVGDFKFTDRGAEAVSTRRLRFLSPVWLIASDGRPYKLKSVGLTNTPNIPGKAILNKEFHQPGGEVVATTQKESPNMDKIKEALGLAPEATDDEVIAKIAEIKAANESLNKEKEEAAAAQADAEAEDFAEKHKDLANKADIKAAYLANKEMTTKLFAGLKTPAPQQVILNKKDCTEPVLKNKATREAMAALPPAARAAYYAQHAAEIDG